METKNLIESIKESKKSIFMLVNEVILCYEMHFKEKGQEETQNAFAIILGALEKVLKNENLDISERDDIELAKQSLIAAQKRLEQGNFGEKLVIKNFSAFSGDENIFKQFLQKCA